jgi:hypothetical protein
MKARVCIALLLVAGAELMRAQELPKTIAETTGYKATSRYADVMAFIGALQKADRDLRVETFATSVEGRVLPLVIAGPPGVVDPATARASGKPVVFIFANIHAGEVEGKEAAQMLLRDLATTHRKVRNDLIVLVAPIYNADGNEKISKTNRTTQIGPAEGVGERENAMGLDLNRDFMKLESPEARGLTGVLQRWDPLVTVDLHTTNGSYHGYQLTYAPMLNPNAPASLIDYSRNALLPEIRAAMKKQHGKETYYYGNFADQLAPEKGWYSFDARPRFGNSYVGLRNRFVILSEAYSYIDFEARVDVTYEFIHEILIATKKHAAQMRKLVAAADAERPRKQGTRFELKPWRNNVPILWERTVAAGAGEGTPDPETGKNRVKRTGEIVTVKTTDHGIFAPIETSDVPHAYGLLAAPAPVVANLLAHGIVVERLDAPATLAVSRFNVEKVDQSPREFQKHRSLSVTGVWSAASAETLPAGTIVVRTDQPLGRLVFYLLEPRSDDGLVTWNFFDPVAAGAALPILKLPKAAGLQATVVR